MELASSLLGAIVGAILGTAGSYLVLRHQIQQARQDAAKARRLAVINDLKSQIDPLLIRSTDHRLKEDRSYGSYIRHGFDEAIKPLYTEGNEKEADKFYDTADEYIKAANDYAEGNIDEGEFNQIRVKTSDQVTSLIRQYKKIES
jgi:hypothetical protein